MTLRRLAHAGHVLVDLLTSLPVFVLILWFVVRSRSATGAAAWTHDETGRRASRWT